MTPRHGVEWLDLDGETSSVHATIRACDHARMVVSRGVVDELAGVVAKQDLLNQVLDGGTLDVAAATRVSPPSCTRACRSWTCSMSFRTGPYAWRSWSTSTGAWKASSRRQTCWRPSPGSCPRWGEVVGDRVQGRIPVAQWHDAGGRGPRSAGHGHDGESDGFATMAGFVIFHLGRIPVDGDSFELMGGGSRSPKWPATASRAFWRAASRGINPRRRWKTGSGSPLHRARIDRPGPLPVCHCRPPPRPMPRPRAGLRSPEGGSVGVAKRPHRYTGSAPRAGVRPRASAVAARSAQRLYGGREGAEDDDEGDDRVPPADLPHGCGCGRPKRPAQEHRSHKHGVEPRARLGAQGEDDVLVGDQSGLHREVEQDHPITSRPGTSRARRPPMTPG